MMEYIRAGDIYIANMTQRLFMDSRKDPYDVFRYLRSHNPSPFGAYLNYGDFQIVCASPERFLQVRGKLREEVSLMDLIRAAFPGGSIGYLSLDGSCDLNIVIRTAVYQDGRYHLGVGGGITCESDTEFEYEETLQKAKAIREAVYECEAG